MARSRQFIDGWRHSEKSLVAWLFDRARSMSDPHARAIMNVAADDFGKWAKGRYRISSGEEAANPDDPVAVFRAAARRDALEEAARIAECLPGSADGRMRQSIHLREIAAAIRAAKER